MGFDVVHLVVETMESTPFARSVDGRIGLFAGVELPVCGEGDRGPGVQRVHRARFSGARSAHVAQRGAEYFYCLGGRFAAFEELDQELFAGEQQTMERPSKTTADLGRLTIPISRIRFWGLVARMNAELGSSASEYSPARDPLPSVKEARGTV